MYSALVHTLLNRGAEVNSADTFNRSPLWWAVNHGHQSAVEGLLANKSAIGYVNGREMSLLSWAIWNGYEDITAQLLANEALSKIAIDDDLEWTIRADNNLLLKELIDRRAIMYGGPFYLMGPSFAVAIEEDNVDALQTLAEHPMLLEDQSTLSHGLLLAASKGYTRCVETLLEVGSKRKHSTVGGDPTRE